MYFFKRRKSTEKSSGRGYPRGRVLGEGRVRLLRFVSTRLPRSARNDKTVRFAAKPSVGRDALVPPPVCLRCHFDRSEDDSPNAVEKSPTGKVYCSCTRDFIIRVQLLSILLRGISRRGTRAREWAGAGTYSAVSYAGDFSTNARNDKEILSNTKTRSCRNGRSVFCVYSVKCGVERCADRASQALCF